MTIKHVSARSTGLASIPKRGFVLLVLAIAIVGFSKNRTSNPTVEKLAPSVPNEVEQQDTDFASSIVVDNSKMTEKLEKETSAEGEQANAVSPRADLSELDGQTKDLLSLVSDNTYGFTKREMPAYWSLLARCSEASFENLSDAAHHLMTFNELYSHPSKHRGELCSLDVVVHRVSRHDATPGNSANASNIYEIWGTTAQSQAWLYVFVTDKLPEGYDENNILKHKAHIVGYFLKVLAYQPGNAAANAKPLAAPVLVGKMDMQPPMKAAQTDDSFSVKVFCALAIVAFIVIVCSFLMKRSKGSPRSNLDNADLSWIQNVH